MAEITAQARAQGDTLVRTAIAAETNSAQLDAFVAAGAQVIEWVSVLDDRTTPECETYDGLQWIPAEDPEDYAGYTPIGHSYEFPGPVAHWNCRSTQIPVGDYSEDMLREMFIGTALETEAQADVFGALQGEPFQAIDDSLFAYDVATDSFREPLAFAREVEPTIYVAKDDVQLEKALGGQEYWVHKDSGEVMKGTMVDKTDLPPTLYHVTTNADAVFNDGFLRGSIGQEGGLGKGTSFAHQGVSTTYSYSDAKLIEQELQRASSLARGEVTDFGKWLKDVGATDEVAAGLAKGKLDDAVTNATEWYRMNREAHPDIDPRSLMHDAYNQYLHGRETRGGAQNPLLMGGWENYAKIKPEQIKLLEINTANIPDAALLRKDPIGDFMHEVMVHSDIPVEIPTDEEVALPVDVHEKRTRFVFEGEKVMPRSQLESLVARTANENGFDPDRIIISDKDPPLHGRGARQTWTSAHYAPYEMFWTDNPGKITIFAKAQTTDFARVRGTIVHEIMHAKVDDLTSVSREGLRPKALVTQSSDLGKRLAKDDGMSQYSGKWWAIWRADKSVQNFDNAYNETLAEIARWHDMTNWQQLRASHNFEIHEPSRTWEAFYKSVIKQHNALPEAIKRFQTEGETIIHPFARDVTLHEVRVQAQPLAPNPSFAELVMKHVKAGPTAQSAASKTDLDKAVRILGKDEFVRQAAQRLADLRIVTSTDRAAQMVVKLARKVIKDAQAAGQAIPARVPRVPRVAPAPAAAPPGRTVAVTVKQLPKKAREALFDKVLSDIDSDALESFALPSVLNTQDAIAQATKLIGRDEFSRLVRRRLGNILMLPDDPAAPAQIEMVARKILSAHAPPPTIIVPAWRQAELDSMKVGTFQRGKPNGRRGINPSWFVQQQNEKVIFKPAFGDEPAYRYSVDTPFYKNEVFVPHIGEMLGEEEIIPPAAFKDFTGEMDINGDKLDFPSPQMIQQYPAMVRRARQTKGLGSAARFVNEAVDGKELKLDGPNAPYDFRKEDLQRGAAFDFLIGATDRYEKNWMVQFADAANRTKKAGGNRLVLIDNGMAMSRNLSEFVSMLLNRAAGGAQSAYGFPTRGAARLPVLDLPHARIAEWVRRWPQVADYLKGEQVPKRVIDSMKARLDVMNNMTDFKELFDWIDVHQFDSTQAGLSTVDQSVIDRRNALRAQSP